MNILRKYYNLCAEILKEDLPLIPPMIMTNAKSYNGQITRVDTVKTINGKEITTNVEIKNIKLSKFNLFVSDFNLEDEDIEDIINTICHEFAHITEWNHGGKHAYLMRKYIRKVINKIELKSSIFYWGNEEPEKKELIEG